VAAPFRSVGGGAIPQRGWRRHSRSTFGWTAWRAGSCQAFADEGDPHITVKADVERLLASPMLSPKVSVSGHVYDIATGRLTTTVDATSSPNS